MVSRQGGLHQDGVWSWVVFHHDGVSSGWSSSGWCLVMGGFSSGWSLVMGGLST